MEHDSTVSDTPGPKSHRIADVNSANEAFVRRAFDLIDKQIGSESAYESNESGHFAWDISLFIRAACLMWRLSGESTHLERATRWAQHVAERTDEAQGLVDWRNRRVPAWSAGARYSAGTATIGYVGGVPLQLQAAADRVIVERPSTSTAVVRAIREEGRSWSSPVLSLLPEDSNYLPDELSRRSASFAVLIRGQPAPTDLTFLSPGEYDVAPQRAAHLVHTGLIARSLVAAGETLAHSEHSATSFGTSPEALYETATKALLLHDEEIRTRSGKSWYVTLEDFPSRRLGLELPHNQVVDAATSFLILGRLCEDKGLRSLGASLTRRFIGEIDAYEAGVLRHPWFYYPVDSDVFFGVLRDEPLAERNVPAVQRGEDSSHATMRIRALLEWRRINPPLVPDGALSSIALAFRRFYMSANNGIPTLKWLPEDTNDSPKRGVADTYIGAWGGLSDWDTSIKRRINSMAYRHPPKTIFGASVLSATEILAMNAGVPTYASSGRIAPK